jgi:hypothetical protein
VINFAPQPVYHKEVSTHHPRNSRMNGLQSSNGRSEFVMVSGAPPEIRSEHLPSTSL